LFHGQTDTLEHQEGVAEEDMQDKPTGDFVRHRLSPHFAALVFIVKLEKQWPK
jgi:hypothetical protein